MYEIRRLSLTASTFRVQVDIIGSTTLYILNVPYIAIDPLFPHHLNTFDNVPINYGTTLVLKFHHILGKFHIKINSHHDISKFNKL